MIKKNKSLKDLLLIHELAFILLIILAATAGAIGIHLWEKSSQESNRISALVSEVQQTRGDLYRQMKELFDAYFLDDLGARDEYNNFTISVEKHFTLLKKITIGEAEKQRLTIYIRVIKSLSLKPPHYLTKTKASITMRQKMLSNVH